MTQRTPARYPATRTVHQDRSDDITLSAVFTLLLILTAVIAAGMVGALVALVIGPALGYLVSRTFAPPATAPVAATCSVCGDPLTSRSSRCSSHR